MNDVEFDERGGRPRRRPQQRRSQEKVDRVLATVESLLVEHRPDQITMRTILERSDVPAGTFYAYFPDKAAAIEQLAFRFVEEVNQLLIDWHRRNQADTWEEVLATGIDEYGRWVSTRPAFVRLWTSDQLGSALVQYEQSSNVYLSTLLREALSEVAPEAGDAPEHVFRFAIELIDQMMRFSFREANASRRRTLEGEVTVAVTSYLANHLPPSQPTSR